MHPNQLAEFGCKCMIRVFSSLHMMHFCSLFGNQNSSRYRQPAHPATEPICVICNNSTASQYLCRYSSEQRTLVPIEEAYFARQWKELHHIPVPIPIYASLTMSKIYLAIESGCAWDQLRWKSTEGKSTRSLPVHRGIGEKAICNSLKVVAVRTQTGN